MKNIIAMIMFAVLAAFIAPGCYKVATVTVDNSPAVTKTVSLGTDLGPIFAKNCALSGCHSAGGQVPDLSGAGAFSSLTAGNFLNTTKPANSTLYLWLTGKESQAMPLGLANNPSNINALVLAWITQGAKNN